MAIDASQFWTDGIRLVISISMQFGAGGQPAKGTDSPFPKVSHGLSKSQKAPTRRAAEPSTRNANAYSITSARNSA